MGFDHNGYVQALSPEPAARACEAIETARRLLQSPKRWGKGDLRTNKTGVTQYCVHGALSRVLGTGGREYVKPHVDDLSAARNAKPKLSLDNHRDTNVIIALTHAILDFAKTSEKHAGWYGARAVYKHSLPDYVSLVYSFNDYAGTTHQDLMTVMKRARKACYDFAIKNANKGGI